MREREGKFVNPKCITGMVVEEEEEGGEGMWFCYQLTKRKKI